MSKWFDVSDSEKQVAYEQVAQKVNLPDYAVEKDWWVVQTLAILFETEVGSHMVFKGGTSLSKAWGLIDRFSEDIDLAIDRNFYGFEGDLGKNSEQIFVKKPILTSRKVFIRNWNPGLKQKGWTLNSGWRKLQQVIRIR